MFRIPNRIGPDTFAGGRDGAKAEMIAGRLLGNRSPIGTLPDLFYVEVQLRTGVG